MATWNIIIDGVVAQSVGSRKLAREVVKQLKAEGKKARAEDAFPKTAITPDVAEALLDADASVHEAAEPVSEEPTADPAVISQNIDGKWVDVDPTIEETMPDGSPVKVAQPVMNGAHVQITTLPIGSHFSVGDTRGVYVGEVGADVKVKIGDKMVQWSSASMVKREAPPAPVVAQVKEPKPASTTGFGKPRQTILGYGLTKFSMALSLLGFNVARQMKVLERFGCTSTAGSISANISQAKREPEKAAELTEEVKAQVLAIV